MRSAARARLRSSEPPSDREIDAHRVADGVAAVGKTCRIANHSAPIRAILRAERAVNAPADACSAKIFWRGRPPHVDFSAHRKTRDNGAVAMRPLRANQKTEAPKLLSSSALLRCVDGVEANRAPREIVCRSVGAMTESHTVASRRTRQLRTNPSAVTVIFFLL